MRILHITESDAASAVGRQVLTLQQEQSKLGHHCEVLTLAKLENENVAPPSSILQTIQQREFDENPAHILASFFTLGYPGHSLLSHPAVRAADVIHLHDVKHLLSPNQIRELATVSGAKMVWSLSDAWSFTGGCHNPHYCQKFTSDCRECPQLHEDRFSLPAEILSDKKVSYEGLDLVIIAPNAWLLEHANKSVVLGHFPAHILTPALPPQSQRASGKEEARQQLGISDDTFLLVIQCEKTGGQLRANHSVRDLVEASARYNTFKRLAKDGKLEIITLGLAEPVEHSTLPVRPWNLGGSEQRERLFQAADLLVLPRADENTSEAVLESMSFGTPVVAFDSLGIAEHIQDKQTGLLIPNWDIQRMAEEICMLSLSPAKLAEMAGNCLQFAARQMDPTQHAGKMLDIYSAAAPAPSVGTARAPVLPRFLFNFAERLVAEKSLAKPKSHLQVDDAAERLKKVIGSAMGKLTVMEARFQRFGDTAKAREAGDFEKAFASLQKLRGTLAKSLVRHENLRILDPIQLATAVLQEGRTMILPARRGLRDPSIQNLHSNEPSPAHFLEGWLGRSLVSREEWSKEKGLGSLHQYPPQPLRYEKFPKPNPGQRNLPPIAIVTPSFMQGHFIERTIASVIDQEYPQLRYAVQDAGSSDETVAILKKHEARITVWNSTPDTGQARAIREGFSKISGKIMGWLNSDDTLMPGTLRYVAEYFLAHPEVDAIYGHRVIIDENGDEVARWVLPPHDPELLGLIDYVPQETLFWRAEIWNQIGGIDPKFRFAMDWDLLLRLSEAGAKIVRVPYFLGCFRVHSEQKTSAVMDTIGAEEVSYLRLRTHGELPSPEKLSYCHKNARHRSAIYEFLLKIGIRI